MTQELTTWQESGNYISYGPFGHRIFVKEIGNQPASSDKTLLLIHGFPESSYSFHAVIEGLLTTFERIILFDFLGFGFSDKPVEGYTYSLFEQADVAFDVWNHFDVKGGHLLSHDMGDSIHTEIIARHENNLLPGWFSEGIQSSTFTNGSMVLELADLRITQKILLSKYGKYMSKLAGSKKIFIKQVKSAHGNSNLSDLEIDRLWELYTLHNGQLKGFLTIKYLNERRRFEKTRWLPALSQTKIPIHICWGDEDAVAKVEMAYYLKEKICKSAEFTIMEGLGHFCQLDSPEKWLQHVLKFYENRSHSEKKL